MKEWFIRYKDKKNGKIKETKESSNLIAVYRKKKEMQEKGIKCEITPKIKIVR